MEGKTRIERLWAGLDTFLLSAVFVLLGVVWYSDCREASEWAKGAAQKGEPSERLFRRPPLSARPVEGFRVSNERHRMNTIARSMVDSGWDRGPTSPAMDMREDGKACELFFTLPAGVTQDKVRVSAAGGVLTLTMLDDESGQVYLQRIRIPRGVTRSDTIQTAVSNDVLRVRICPSGG